MNKTLILSAAAALTLLGCASHERHYARTHYSTQPDVVVVEPGDRTYVREYDPRYDTRYDSRYDSRYDTRRWDNQPHVPGKHAESLGWNDRQWNGY